MQDEPSPPFQRATRGPSWAWIGVCAVLGALAGGGLGGWVGHRLVEISPTRYRSHTVIEVERGKRDSSELNRGDSDSLRLTGFAVIAATVEKLRMPRIYHAVASVHLFLNRKGLNPKQPNAEVSTPELEAMMPSWIQVNWRENTNMIDVYCTHTDPEVARDVLQALLTEYEKLTEAHTRISTDYSTNYVPGKTKEMKEAMVKGQETLSRYNRCLDLTQQVRTAEASPNGREMAVEWRKKVAQELEQVSTSSPEEKEFWQQQSAGLARLEGDALASAQLKAVEARTSILRKELEFNQAILETLLKEQKTSDADPTRRNSQFKVVQPPTLPSQPVAPGLPLSPSIGITLGTLFGCLAGALGGVILVAILRISRAG